MRKGTFYFEQLNNLSIFELKAQKKSPNLKKFLNIPLSPQEQAILRFDHKDAVIQKVSQSFRSEQYQEKENRSPYRHQTVTIFKKKPQPLNSLSQSASLQKLMKKCKSLKSSYLTIRKLNREERKRERMYNDLAQQSNAFMMAHPNLF